MTIFHFVYNTSCNYQSKPPIFFGKNIFNFICYPWLALLCFEAQSAHVLVIYSITVTKYLTETHVLCLFPGDSLTNICLTPIRHWNREKKNSIHVWLSDPVHLPGSLWEYRQGFTYWRRLKTAASFKKPT